MRLSMTLTLILVCILSGPVLALKDRPEGAPGFGLALRPFPGVDSDGAVRILVSSWSIQHGTNRIGSVKVELPPGTEVLEGQAERNVHPSRAWAGPIDCEWLLRVRLPPGEKHEIRGSMRIYIDQNSYDETECLLRVSFVDGSVEYLGGHPRRFERVSGGSRYRYGGQYLVEIDGPEVVANVPFERRASVTSLAPANCRDCSEVVPQVVRLVLTVTRTGSPRWIRSADGLLDSTSAVFRAAVEAARSSVYQPALKGGVPVADWLRIDVSVQPDGK